jgi:hypothetical protein
MVTPKTDPANKPAKILNQYRFITYRLYKHGMRRQIVAAVKRIIIENMDRRIFHGNIKPNDIAHALMAEFNRGNMYAQVLGSTGKMAVQVATRNGAMSGGQTALTINIQSVEDGIMVELGEVTALKEALVGLLGDPRLRQRLGKAGSYKAAERYSLQRCVGEYERLFLSLADASATR